MESWSINWSENDWDSKSADRVLSPSFYERDTLQVARETLGKVIVVRTQSQVVAARIVETEAYHGTDPAAHCARGETPRCSIMFGDPGVAYVYFIYGMYEMLNFVTERKGYPGAVLIRAVEPVFGEEVMRRRRKVKNRIDLTNGPGRLCRALGIRMSDKGQSLSGPRLFVMDDGFQVQRIGVSTRVGISVGTDKPWRYFIDGNPFVSKARQNSTARIWAGGEL